MYYSSRRWQLEKRVLYYGTICFLHMHVSGKKTEICFFLPRKFSRHWQPDVTPDADVTARGGGGGCDGMHALAERGEKYMSTVNLQKVARKDDFTVPHSCNNLFFRQAVVTSAREIVT
jgi:hypothetical protein